MQRTPADRVGRARRDLPSRARRRRRLLLPLLVAAVGVGVVVSVVSRSGGVGSVSVGSVSLGGADAQSRPPRALVAEALPDPLPAPISGEATAEGAGGVLILGGLDSNEASVNGVFVLRPRGGAEAAGALAAPVHDAAAARLGGRVLLFGGGTATSTDTVQSLPAWVARGGAARAAVVGRLPRPRSDLSAVTVDGKAYVLGGYDGTRLDPGVLATADGRTFSRVATLPVPARYMAVASLDRRIYAFGGASLSGAATDAIREIDPASGRTRLVGHLPVPLSHAAAVALGGSIYVLGGEQGGKATRRVWRFRPGDTRVSPARPLPLAVSGAAAASSGGVAYLVGGTGAAGAPLSSVLALRLRGPAETNGTSRAGRGGTSGPGASASAGHGPSPFEGRLMIADRGNNRIIVVDARKRVLWRYPSKAHPAPPGGFYFPDDAFFIRGGTGIISNEEENEAIVQLSYPGGKVTWSYGHPHQTGSAPGYLHEPDDAYLLNDGNVSVADAQNCRVLIISPAKKVLREFGSPLECAHEPPRRLGSPNGDTPLANGDILVSEVNGSYIDEITRSGRLVWSAQLPISYPSDPQQIGPDRYLVVDYANPGGIYEFNRTGRILWSYAPAAGNGRLDHPSLAERLPNGDICVNDDYRDRVVIVDPRTKRVVWQYGATDRPGRGPNRLNTPDGFDLLAPDGTTPTHPFTG